MPNDYNENRLNSFYTYYVYILTNKYRTTLYIGVTNNLQRRLSEHVSSKQNNLKNFTAHYHVVELIYFEAYTWIQIAIAREKELKGWKRDKKLALIRLTNPTLKTLAL